MLASRREASQKCAKLNPTVRASIVIYYNSVLSNTARRMAPKDDTRSVSIDLQGEVLREQLDKSRYLMRTPGRFRVLVATTMQIFATSNEQQEGMMAVEIVATRNGPI